MPAYLQYNNQYMQITGQYCNVPYRLLPIYEPLNYPIGTLRYDDYNWKCMFSPVNDVSVVAGNLLYTELRQSGNRLSFVGTGDDCFIPFETITNVDVSIYYSFVFQITNMGSSIAGGVPAQITSLNPNSTTTIFDGGCFQVQRDTIDSTKFNIAFTTRSVLVSFDPLNTWHNIGGVKVQYSMNTPIFIIGCYNSKGVYVSGNGNDTVCCWINPSTSFFENALPPTPTMTSSLVGWFINDASIIGSFRIKQDADSNTPAVEISDIRIGLSWASVTPKA